MAEFLEITTPEEAQTAAGLYNLFAGVMGYKIDSSWLEPSFQEKLKMALPEVEGKQEVLYSLTLASQDAKAYEEIQLEYDALFIVPGPKLIFPYESCYTHRNIDGSFGRLWQEPAQDMQRILKEWDIKFPEGGQLIPDHIAVELFFMGHLWHLLSKEELKMEDGEKIQGWKRRFLENHLNNWAFELLENLKRKAETSFFKGIAWLLGSFLEEEISY